MSVYKALLQMNDNDDDDEYPGHKVCSKHLDCINPKYIQIYQWNNMRILV